MNIYACEFVCVCVCLYVTLIVSQGRTLPQCISFSYNFSGMSVVVQGRVIVKDFSISHFLSEKSRNYYRPPPVTHGHTHGILIGTVGSDGHTEAHVIKNQVGLN